MITGALKSKIDKLWTEFWTGGITNPLTVIEQISFLIFARLLDIRENLNIVKSKRSTNVRFIFSQQDQDLRWHKFKQMPAQSMLEIVRDRVFPHFKTIALNGAKFGEYMKDAQLMIMKPNLLVSAVNMIDELPIEKADLKGDLYEYLLSKLKTAGISGQFRTPRHIIRLMVEMLDPKANEAIGDPACGTAGFLVAAMEHIMRENTSEDGKIVREDGEVVYTGDLLEKNFGITIQEHMQGNMLHGFDFDSTMLRIAAMNLLLHGVNAPDIHYQDTLSNSFQDRYPKLASDGFDVILANPPFKGNLDYDDVDPYLLSKVKTRKTELLFVTRMLKMLKNGGRAATIVPDGVLFGSTKAHVALRQLLIDENQLEAIISLPSGVFKPYAGVKTAILIFTRGGESNKIFYYDLKDDGFSLDDKREDLNNDGGDLPDCLSSWNSRTENRLEDRKEKAFFVTVSEVRENNYDLSVNRYKEISYKEEVYAPPREIIGKVEELEKEITKNLNELKKTII